VHYWRPENQLHRPVQERVESRKMKLEVASDGGKYQTEREGASERARARAQIQKRAMGGGSVPRGLARHVWNAALWLAAALPQRKSARVMTRNTWQKRVLLNSYVVKYPRCSRVKAYVKGLTRIIRACARRNWAWFQ
jgi:hypothetical protein